MTGRRGQLGKRGGRVVGGAGAIGAFLALGAGPLAAAPSAHADFDDIFQPIINAIDEVITAVDPSAGVDDVAGSALATSLIDPLTSLDALLSGSAPGAAEAGSAAAAAAADTPTNATVNLQVLDNTEPVVDVSVGGGPSTPVLVDTGSDGLIIPWQDVNWSDVGAPTNFGVGSFSGGMDYLYAALPTTVGFTTTTGADITTGQTPVDVELFAFPTSLQGLLSGEFTLNNFLGGSADGILGVGPNAIGPGSSSPITALPGDLSDGVLIDQPNHELVFGPDPLTGGVSVSGAPNANLEVSIGGGAPQPVPAIIDSGGVYGTLPSTLFGGAVGDILKPGTVVSVSTGDGQPLYSYPVGTDASGVSTSPTFTSDTTMNTGNIPFEQMPVYISNSPGGQGTTIFGGTS